MEIIAEIGINHNGNFKYIEELVRQAALGGANAAKFQLYNSQRVFGDDSRKQNEFTFEQVQNIKNLCDAYGIEFFASVFDEEKIEWCESLGISRYKLASRTVLKEHGLCCKVIALGKPVIASLGMWEEEHLPFSAPNVKYLRCISKYPTSLLELSTFYPFKNGSPIVGISDHSYGISYTLYAIAHGATVVEKHFTLDKSQAGPDHIGSMDIDELKLLNTVGRELSRVSHVIEQT